MSRVDLFTPIHKALRSALFAAATRTARTDWQNRTEAATAADHILHLLGLLDEHGEHEDVFVLAELAAIAPDTLIDLEAQHARLQGLQRELRRLIAALPDARADQRAELGLRIEARLHRLVAEHLLHMEREETHANPVLWAHRTDAQLLAIRQAIQAVVPPARMAEWLELMLPAIAMPERTAVLTGMAQAMPPALFQQLTARARQALGTDGWPQRLAQAS